MTNFYEESNDILTGSYKLIGYKDLNFDTSDGHVKGVQLYFVLSEGADPSIVGQGCSFHFIPNSSSSEYSLGGNYTPVLAVKVRNGKAVPYVKGFMLSE